MWEAVNIGQLILGSLGPPIRKALVAFLDWCNCVTGGPDYIQSIKKEVACGEF